MDFQAPNPAPEKASGFINNEILVSTSKGVVCLTLANGIPSNLNFSQEDLQSVVEQLVINNETGQNIYIASHSDETTVDSDEPTSSDCSAIRVMHLNPTMLTKTIQQQTDIKPKRRGGWPKGRKRKPELLYLPPKAPATGYNLYLNEMRKTFKHSGLAFHEITKIVGYQWSNLTLEDKRPFLLKAEEDKRRYKEELREYRQSGSYQLYLAKKRKKRVLNNILSESDMDATDDIDDEDNEELYCRMCDQWFHNLHNKREHLQSRLHIQAVVGDIRNELGSETETSTAHSESKQEQKSISEIMADLITAASNREKDIKNLNMLISEGEAVKTALSQQLLSLKERELQLQQELSMSKALEHDTQSKLFDLWKVPSIFVTTDLVYSDLEGSEYSVTE